MSNDTSGITVSGVGWTCPRCGARVSHGTPHFCWSTADPIPFKQPPAPESKGDIYYPKCPCCGAKLEVRVREVRER